LVSSTTSSTGSEEIEEEDVVQPAVEEVEAVVEVTVQTISLEVRTFWSAGGLAAPASLRVRERPSVGTMG